MNNEPLTMNNEPLIMNNEPLIVNNEPFIASVRLFVHRNSLQYRLNKVKELLGIELDDYTEYLDLINCILVKKWTFS